jgi:uncharacterized protein (TIGR02145 family)
MKTSKCLFLAAASAALAFMFYGCSGDDGGDSGGSCDIRDYKTVEIGTQIWMAENLNCNVSGSKCNENLANCTKYGRLYDWATAMALQSSCNSSSCSNMIQVKHQGICPFGWHVPSKEEWETLINYAGGSLTAGTRLKATSGWDSSDIPAGTDTYGFTALPGGGSGYIGEHGAWWSNTEYDAYFAYSLEMSYYSERVSAASTGNKNYGFYSVRCLKD